MSAPATAGTAPRTVNVGDGERLVSAVGGGLLAVYGLLRGSLNGLALAALGGVLGYRGVTGHCAVYERLGINTAARPVIGNLGVKVDRSITVEAPAARLYGFWRNFENLPRIMSHVEQVVVLNETRSRWIVGTPVGMRLEWEAEIINDQPPGLIAWRSIGQPLVEHAGSVHFRALGDRATSIEVHLQYDPPGGELGHTLASVFNEDAASLLERDLQTFKRAFESGTLAAA